MHGINSCDTIKKAKKWLTDAGIEFSFRDYKKQPPSVIELQKWATQVGWEVLLNKRGTTWRKLPAEQQEAVNEEPVNEETICELLAAHPSMIKRPLVIVQNEQQIQAIVGFKAEQYAIIFQL